MAKITRTLRVAEATKLTLTALVFTAMLMLGTPNINETENITARDRESSSRLSARNDEQDEKKEADEFEVVFIDDLDRQLVVVLDPNTGTVKHIDDTKLT